MENISLDLFESQARSVLSRNDIPHFRDKMFTHFVLKMTLRHMTCVYTLQLKRAVEPRKNFIMPGHYKKIQPAQEQIRTRVLL